MYSGLAIALVRQFDEKPSVNIAPLVPFAAPRAAFNLPALERAWFDGLGRFKCMARGAA